MVLKCCDQENKKGGEGRGLGVSKCGAWRSNEPHRLLWYNWCPPCPRPRPSNNE